jgi:hypothetical protein
MLQSILLKAKYTTQANQQLRICGSKLASIMALFPSSARHMEREPEDMFHQGSNCAQPPNHIDS